MAGGWREDTLQETKTRIYADFTLETMQARRQWSKISYVLTAENSIFSEIILKKKKESEVKMFSNRHTHTSENL